MQAACGLHHTLAIVSLRDTKCSRAVFSWGASGKKQTGHGRVSTERKICLPREISCLRENYVSHVRAGGDHSAAVSGQGVWKGNKGTSFLCAVIVFILTNKCRRESYSMGSKFFSWKRYVQSFSANF